MTLASSSLPAQEELVETAFVHAHVDPDSSYHNASAKPTPTAADRP